jgi:hypothetical protein
MFGGIGARRSHETAEITGLFHDFDSVPGSPINQIVRQYFSSSSRHRLTARATHLLNTFLRVPVTAAAIGKTWSEREKLR